MPCHSPLTIEHNGISYQVPCRWCMGCRIDRRNLWSLRCRFEMSEQYKKGYGSSFVTLTYAPEHYKGGLVKNDVKLFLKRLREYMRRRKGGLNYNKDYKYYLVGENGELGQRGHYHIAFMGLSASYLNLFIRSVWDFGFVSVEPLNLSRINYTLKYMDKSIFDKKLKVDENGFDLPFSLCSKGIGSKTLKELSSDALETGVLQNGTCFIKFPLYYAKKFGIDSEQIKLIQLENLKNSAKNNNMTLAEFTSRYNYLSELTAVSSARCGSQAVDTRKLDISKASIVNADSDFKLVNDIIKDI